MRHQSELGNTGHDVFRPNDLDFSSEMVKIMRNTKVHGHVFCSTLHLFAWWQRIESLTEKKEFIKDEEGEEVGIQVEEVFEVERAPLLRTCALGHYE